MYVTPAMPGVTRVRSGAKAFRYRLPDGQWLQDPDEVARIKRLAIPPAYTDVWICPLPHGHLQATGLDARGRRQYRYHPQWRAQRDEGGPADRVNVYVDFDGDNRSGYNFTVLLSGSIIDTTITNENQFNDDWDGDWRSATSEDEQGWYAELLIPWHIAPMQKATGATRTIGLSVDRVIGATGERMAWPAITYTEQRFMSNFSRVEVPTFSQSLLAITPYVVGVHDNVAGRSDFDAGADLFWKPSGQFQLSATLNPDFGQVESDELVVNFGAIETFFSDKRPFFTENQGFFDVPFGGLSGANRLLYTRRVGDPADDGRGSGDVTAAAKVNGSVGALDAPLTAPVNFFECTELVVCDPHTSQPLPASWTAREAQDCAVMLPIKRAPGLNDVGMVAWIVRLTSPEVPEGREFVVISNDITFQAGSFGTREDVVFYKVSFCIFAFYSLVKMRNWLGFSL